MSFFSKKITLILIAVIIAISAFIILTSKQNQTLPLIAIANWGPHPSLEDTITGFQDEMKKLGYEEQKNIRYDVQHVNFQSTLILQMLSKLKAQEPKILIAISTPIAQAAKSQIKNIPVLFADVTDPVDAGLLSQPDKGEKNINGASDQQNLDAFLNFATQILPDANNIGILYSTAEANDQALLEMMKASAAKKGMRVKAIPIDEPREVAVKIQALKDNVDFLYVGSSGVIQSAFPMIINEADKMKIPVFNFDPEAARRHEVLASYGVSYPKVGANLAHLADQVLKGAAPADLSPSYPKIEDHFGVISSKKAKAFKIDVSHLPAHTEIVG